MYVCIYIYTYIYIYRVRHKYLSYFKLSSVWCNATQANCNVI